MLQTPPVYRLFLIAYAAAVVLGLVLRVALALAWLPSGSWLWPMPWLVLAGLLQDALVWGAVLSPVAALACFSRLELRQRYLAWFAIGLLVAGIAYLSVVEWYFAEEFTARFNHIAVDYLLYPDEVATNMWEGYPVIPWLGACAAVGGLAAWCTGSWLERACPSCWSWPKRSALALLTLLLGGLGLMGALYFPRMGGTDRLANEIAANGVAGFVRAAWTADLEYDAFYATLGRERALATLPAVLGPSGLARPQKKPKQVVVLLEESLGQEFVGSLGGANPCTPEFDRWSQRGLVWTNLIATGNRTVRGMEGVLASLPPVPPESVVKHSDSVGLPTLASAFAAQGFSTAFFYGGAASFDHMGPWLLSHGWQEIIDDGLFGTSHYPPEAFRTAWGVCDAVVLDTLLQRQVVEQAAGRPFFATALTVSNHKPFLVPEPFGHPRPLTSARLQRFVLLALMITGGLGVLWWRARAALGIPALSLLSVFFLLGYTVYVYVNGTERDSRETAVAYADHAIGQYLDGLEAKGLLDDTLVLIVGDHGARVYGSAEIPFPSYRIPALFLAPGGAYAGERVNRLCSQIDLGPTLLNLAGIPIPDGFFGRDPLGLPEQGGRALLQHNRDIALLSDTRCVALNLGKSVQYYERDGEDLRPVANPDASWESFAHQVQAMFEVAYHRTQGQAAAWPLPMAH